MSLNNVFATLWCMLSSSFLPLLIRSEKCYNAYQCAYDTIFETGTASIECLGDHSCYNADAISSTSESNIYCHGSYSCSSSTLIQHTGTSDYDRPIRCFGLNSCSDVNLIYNAFGDLQCWGELSCASSSITLNSGDLYCWGDHSCANSVIESGGTNHISGHLAGYKAVFKSLNSLTSYEFYGTESGKDAIVLCPDSTSCYVTCYSNACNDLTLNCGNDENSDTGNCTYHIDCSYGEKSTVCSDKDGISSFMYEIPSLEDVIVSTKNNSEIICQNDTNANTIICDDVLECANEKSLDTRNKLAPVCCSATYGCNNVTNITSHIDFSSGSSGSEWHFDVAIRCDGYKSCDDIISTITTTNGGDIYLSGAYATFDEVTITVIETTSEYDIYCAAFYSCRYKILQNAKNVYCGGSESCYFATLISNVDTVWAYGYFSAIGATMTDISGSVYCGTYSSCYSSSIINVGGDVYGNGYQSLYDSSIDNVEGSVLGFGSQSLYLARINNVTDVYCDGEESCQSSTISNVQNIRAYGINVFSGATIVSNISKDLSVNATKRTLIALINGTNVNEYSFYCNLTDICKIGCQSEYACSTMELYCYGTCYVACGVAKSIDCPIILSGSYSDWATDAPSPSPTFIPSTQPTNMPSIDPTGMPTTAPTGPTNNPTDGPTESPVVETTPGVTTTNAGGGTPSATTATTTEETATSTETETTTSMTDTESVETTISVTTATTTTVTGGPVTSVTSVTSVTEGIVSTFFPYPLTTVGNSGSNTSSDNSGIGIIIGAVVAGIVIIILLFVVCLKLRSRSKENQVNDVGMINIQRMKSRESMSSNTHTDLVILTGGTDTPGGDGDEISPSMPESGSGGRGSIIPRGPTGFAAAAARVNVKSASRTRDASIAASPTMDDDDQSFHGTDIRYGE